MADTKNRRRLSTKITLMFLILLVIVMTAIGFVTYRISYNAVLNDYNSIGESAGILAADVIDTEQIGTWLEKGPDAAYEETYGLLLSIKKAYGLQYLYASIPCLDQSGAMINDTVYVFDAMIPGEDPAMFGVLGEHSGEVDVYEQCKYVYTTGNTVKSDVITNSEFGWLLSVYVPMKNDAGVPVGWIGVDIEMTQLIHNVNMQTFIIVSLIAGMIAVFALIFILYFRRRVVAPVKELSTHMNNFVSHSAGIDYKPVSTISTNDEIEQMADDFNSMAKSILSYTVNLEKSTVERERLRSEMNVSEQIRSSLAGDMEYPAFPDRSEFEVCGSMKNTVFNKNSYCSCFLTDENTLFLVVGESVGRSLASMLATILAATNIRCYAKMGYQPYRIAVETNNQISIFCKDRSELTVQAMIAQIDLKTGVMKYVNAGMPPVLLKETGTGFAYENKPVGFNLGQMPGISFTQESVRLTQGNMVMLMSHGVPDMKNEKGMEFTSPYVEAGINMIAAREYDLHKMSDLFDNMLANFRGNAELESDTSTILFRYFG